MGVPDANTPVDSDQVQETGATVQEQANDFDQITSNAEICDNTLDDDGDNLIDSDDPDCNLSAETATSGGGEATTATATEQQQLSSTETPPEQANGGENTLPKSTPTEDAYVCTPDDQADSVCTSGEQRGGELGPSPTETPPPSGTFDGGENTLTPTGDTPPVPSEMGGGENIPVSPSDSSPTPVTTSTCDPNSGLVMFGDEGPKVVEIQNYLVQLGYEKLLGKHGPSQVAVDGKFKGDTRRAVIQFQKDNQLKKIDGKVGPETWNAFCEKIGQFGKNDSSSCLSYVGGVCPKFPPQTGGCLAYVGGVCPPIIPPQYQKILDKLLELERSASYRGGYYDDVKSGTYFSYVIREFRSDLKNRIEATDFNYQGPPSLSIILEALKLWSNDPGDQWGAGWIDSNDFKPSATCYVTVPAYQYKCNAYVAEVIYLATGVTFKVYESDQVPGQYFPYKAADWADLTKTIPHFDITQNPEPGDIWSNGHHTGIYLGTFGYKLYVSARDDSDGVFAWSTA